MSDKKKGFNEPPASKAPSKTLPKAGSFCKRLEECFRSMKTLEKDSEGLADYGKLVDEHAALKKEVVAKAQATEALRAQKDEEIAKLVAETKDLTVRKDVLFDEFHKKGREFDGRLTETRNLEDQIRRLQNELAKSKQEYDALNEECRDIQADLNNQKMQLREGENWRAEAEESRAQVSRLERQAAEGQLHSVDLQGLQRDLERLAANCHALVLDQFRPRVDARLSLGSSLGSSLRKQVPHLPLPAPVSPSARLMWCAMVEAIVGQALTKHVFLDFYRPEDPATRRAMSTALDALSPQRQKMVRCQILADNPPSEEDYRAAAEAAQGDVLTRLVPVLSDQPPGEGLLDRLLELFMEATEIWGEVQRAPWRAVVSMSREAVKLGGDDATGNYTEYGQFVTTQDDKTMPHHDAPVTVTPLFPRIVFQDGKKKGSLFDGVALWSNQKVFLQARLEAEALETRNTRSGEFRLSSGGTKRRMSIASPSSPASPTLSTSTFKSQKAPGGQRPPPSAGTDSPSKSSGKRVPGKVVERAE